MKYIKIGIFTLIIVCSIFSVVYANDIVNKNKNIMLVNNQVTYEGKTLTNSKEKKSYLTTSLNEKKVAFLSNDGYGRIGIVSLVEGSTIYASLENIFFTSCWDIRWINDNQLAFKGHVNPSLDVYCIFDATNGKLIKKYNGLGFLWNEDNSKLCYVLPQPHFSDLRGEDKVFINEHIVYKSSPESVIIGKPSADTTMNKIAFFEKSLSNESIELVICNNSLDRTLSIEKRISWENEYGKIIFNQDDTINVISKFKDIRYDIEKNLVLDEKTIKFDKTENPYLKQIKEEEK